MYEVILLAFLPLLAVFLFLSWRIVRIGEKINKDRQGISDSLGNMQKETLKSLSDAERNTSDAVHSLNVKTVKSLGELSEKLEGVKNFESQFTDLSKNMESFISLVSNSGQDRGKFGEMQLEMLVQDALPRSAYDFQKTLSNGKRPDCFLILPSPLGNVMVDAKFPLENYKNLMKDPNNSAFSSRFAREISDYIKDISKKYIVPGETADFAFLFLPSDAIYSELQANKYQHVFNTSKANRVFIVSPLIFVAALAMLQRVFRDVQLGEKNKELLNQLVSVYKIADSMGQDLQKAQRAVRTVGERIHDLEKSTNKMINCVKTVENIEKGKIEGVS